MHKLKSRNEREKEMCPDGGIVGEWNIAKYNLELVRNKQIWKQTQKQKQEFMPIFVVFLSPNVEYYIFILLIFRPNFKRSLFRLFRSLSTDTRVCVCEVSCACMCARTVFHLCLYLYRALVWVCNLIVVVCFYTHIYTYIPLLEQCTYIIHIEGDIGKEKKDERKWVLLSNTLI